MTFICNNVTTLRLSSLIYVLQKTKKLRMNLKSRTKLFLHRIILPYVMRDIFEFYFAF